MPDARDPAVVAWTQAQHYADKLFDALEALDEAGGLSQAGASAGWSSKSLGKALTTLEATRSAIVAHLVTNRPTAPPKPSTVPASAPSRGPIPINRRRASV